MSRSLLKWNVNDLVSRVKSIIPRRIEGFERGIVHIQEWENDELVTVFRKHGIIFRPNLDPLLNRGGDDFNRQEAESMRGFGARIVLDANLNVISDSSDARTFLLGQGIKKKVSDKKKAGEEKDEEITESVEKKNTPI